MKKELVNKQVSYLLPATLIDMGGFPVKQPLPTNRVDQVDPFLLLHHARNKFNDDRPARAQGVGPHPHRGFSPVTFVIDGEIHHRDSRGNNQVAKAGEVQWMHAGAGIIHSERPSENLVARSGYQEIVQVWINTPSVRKMEEPYYLYLSDEQIPKIISEDSLVTSKVIAGGYSGVNGPAKTESELLIIWGKASNSSSITYQIPTQFNAILYLINGAVKVSGFGMVEPETLIAFDPEGDQIALSFDGAAQFLLLCGKPVGEKLAQYGPFVMNSQTEILEAMRDYQMGKMGFLVEED